MTGENLIAKYALHTISVPTKGREEDAVTVTQFLKGRTPRNVYMVTIDQTARNAFLSIFANIIVKNTLASSVRGVQSVTTIGGGTPVWIVRVHVYAFIKSKGEIVFNATGAIYVIMGNVGQSVANALVHPYVCTISRGVHAMSVVDLRYAFMAKRREIVVSAPNVTYTCARNVPQYRLAV